MSVGTNYSTPVSVNGFQCKNCTDVDYAKKHIDPAHPRSGPYGINAKDDPSNRQAATSAAVVFAGSLSGLNAHGSAAVPDDAEPSQAEEPSIGKRLDLSA